MKLFKRIISILFTIVLLAWIGVLAFDYYQTLNEKEPTFCFSKKTYTYDDGSVTECVGALYKVIKYERTEITGYELVPIWKNRKEKYPNK